MRTALLVMVHGSPKTEANEDMFRVVEAIRRRNIFDDVSAGFMECNEPSIPNAVEAAIARGAERIVAVPYFLHTGKHVADDLPTLLDEAKERHSQVQFTMGKYIGASERLTEILAERAANAVASRP